MPNYKDGGSWTAITDAALWSTYGGTYHVEYPPARDLDGYGRPCGAFGKPRIVIAASWMNGEGMAFWRGLFVSASDQYASLSIEALNPRTGDTEKWAGLLKWPTFASVSWGATAAKTIYRDVRIEVVECEATT